MYDTKQNGVWELVCKYSNFCISLCYDTGLLPYLLDVNSWTGKGHDVEKWEPKCGRKRRDVSPISKLCSGGLEPLKFRSA